MAPEAVERYFVPADGEYEIKKQIRALTVFGQHDLGQRAPFPRIDLTLCRNVLIYFTPELQKRALQLFAFSLRDDGFLVLGKAETTSPLSEYFVLEQPRLKVYRRRGERVLIPPARIRDSAPVPIRPALVPLGWHEPQRRPGRDPRMSTAAERAESLLLRLPVEVVTVDESHDIHWLNAAARRLLGIHTSAVGHDFVQLASLPSSQLRQAIDAAFRGEARRARFDVGNDDGAPPARRWLEVAFQPHSSGGGQNGTNLVAIVVADITEPAVEQRRLADALAESRQLVEQLGAQVRQLSQSHAALLQANEELTTANVELRSSNEELLGANEELQATNEELETLNEELQATNEELETLNEELQATVEELNTTNDDLEARTVELQDLASSLAEEKRGSEAGRARLEAAVAALSVPVLVVDARGRRVLVNAAFEATFPPDSALEDENGRPLAGSSSIEALAAGSQQGFERGVAVRGHDGDSRRYRARAVPVSAEGQLIGGVVLFEALDQP